jgi:hypothetical protein
MPNNATRDLADVAADLLEAEARQLAESQTKLQADFEAREAKFNADLEALVPATSKCGANAPPVVHWLLARKCWSWLYHD